MRRSLLSALLFACSSSSIGCTVTVHQVAGRAPTIEVSGAPAEPVARPADRGPVAGLVVDEAGRPMRAKVSLVHPGGSRSTSVPESGQFRFTDLPDRSFVLTATTEDGRIATIEGVVPGSDELRVPVVDRGGRLAFSMAGRPTVRLAVMHGETRIHDLTVREGRPCELVVPSGPIRLELRANDLFRSMPAEIASGETLRFSVTLDD